MIKKYSLRDFTQKHYRALLKTALKDNNFRSFTDFKKSKKCIILRHDIDASVEAALKIAEIESEMGIKANYFILLHSPWYNLLEKKQSDCVKKIIELGHNIGLHFDARYYSIRTELELGKHLKFEKRFLEDLFNIKIEAFAFHNPDAKDLCFKKWKYAGMINTYSHFFSEKIGYISDSNGYWRHNRLADEIKRRNSNVLQVLTHPIFWQEKAAYPKHKIWRNITDSGDRILKEYDKLLVDCKRLNIGEISDDLAKNRHMNKDARFRIEKLWIQEDYEIALLSFWITCSKQLHKIERDSGTPLRSVLVSSGVRVSEYKDLSIMINRIINGEMKLGHLKAMKSFRILSGIVAAINNKT